MLQPLWLVKEATHGHVIVITNTVVLLNETFFFLEGNYNKALISNVDIFNNLFTTKMVPSRLQKCTDL